MVEEEGKNGVKMPAEIIFLLQRRSKILNTNTTEQVTKTDKT